MRLISTRNWTTAISWRDGVLMGLAPDGGLLLPHPLPKFSPHTLSAMRGMQFSEIALATVQLLLGDEVSPLLLEEFCTTAFSFPVPLVEVRPNLFVLELFHGPTCAFKDFGARFMSRLFRSFLGESTRPLTVLVATSGDTGGAVANAFHSTDPQYPIRVVVLYPKGKVSAVQELQMTTLGGNVVALEVDGTFDDCQLLVKSALADADLVKHCPLTTANSINIARLVPQIMYYLSAWSRLKEGALPTFYVPSGNLGNLTGGVIAHLMGMPATGFVAACNSNDSFVRFLNGSLFIPHSSYPTLSNAMDVGNPSNFERLTALASLHAFTLSHLISGFTASDSMTVETCASIFKESGYVSDPHTAVGFAAAAASSRDFSKDTPAIVLATAHPAKFADFVTAALGGPPEMPIQMRDLGERVVVKRGLSRGYQEFVNLLLG